MTDEVYLELETKDFERKKKEAIKRANENAPNDEPNNNMLWENLKVETTEQKFDLESQTLDFSGSLIDTNDDEKHLGFISLKLDLDLETVLEIINLYMKRLGKLKTVLEATKDLK